MDQANCPLGQSQGDSRGDQYALTRLEVNIFYTAQIGPSIIRVRALR